MRHTAHTAQLTNTAMALLAEATPDAGTRDRATPVGTVPGWSVAADAAGEGNR